MTPQEIAQRAAEAKAQFDRWLAAELAEDHHVAPDALFNRAIRNFNGDDYFMPGWVAYSFKESIAAHFARRPGIFDAGEPTGDLVKRDGARKSAVRVRKETAPNGWSAWLDKKEAPARTKLLRRDDLVRIVAAEREEVARHATFVRMAEALLTRLPTEGNPMVGDFWTQEEIDNITHAAEVTAVHPIAMVAERCEKGAD